jgi:DNA-directed RNA polymerase specialized sigma24 family protein
VSEELETTASAATVGTEPFRVDVRAFAELYAEHAAHVFDYCRALVGSDAVAASATSAALGYAPQLPTSSPLLRARLIAAGRQQALAFAAAGPGWSGTGDARRETADAAVAAALRQLPPGHREVLALVYRHGIWPEQLPAVLGVPAKDAYERLAAAEHDFLTVATEHEAAGSSARRSAHGGPSLEDIGAAPLAAVPGSVWRDAIAEMTAGTSVTAALPLSLPAGHADGPLARPRRRLRLTIAAALPAVAVGCWVIVAGAGSAHPVGVHDTGEPSAITIAPRSARSTATPDGAGTAPAKQSTGPVRPGAAPVIPVLALLPSTAAGAPPPVTSTSAAADATPETSPSGSASPSSSPSPSPSSAAPSPTSSPSSAAPSPSESASASPSASTSSVTPSPSPSASASSASPSVPDPSPAS